MTEQQARREAYLDIVNHLEKYLALMNNKLPPAAIMSPKDAAWANALLQIIKELRDQILDKAAKVK